MVEDEPAVGEVVALLLRDFGYQVLTAENGEAAEQLIARHAGAIDLVLTDLNMPRMNGRELMERLTTNNPGVRVILTSGNDDLLDEHSAQSLEIEFLPKPFTGRGLAERVRQVLDRSPPPALHETNRANQPNDSKAHSPRKIDVVQEMRFIVNP